LTTAYELSDDEARSIIGQIEEASGRPVDATRSVDPELIGGIVLQARTMRGDASGRGRLGRLRRDLPTARQRKPEYRGEPVKLRPEEITQILKSRIEQYDVQTDLSEVGTVLEIGDGIARVYGLENAVASEMLEFEHDVVGIAFNLEEDDVGVALFGEWQHV